MLKRELTVDNVVRALGHERWVLRITKIDETDIRLCVHSDPVWDGWWGLAVGDVSYDTEHADYCGAGTLRADDTDADLRALASELLSQVEDQKAEDQ